MRFSRRSMLLGLPFAGAAAFAWRAASAPPPSLAAEGWAQKLIAAAEAQVGVTLIYDPAYVQLNYPGGDIPLLRGVCTDVIVRAYRTAFGIDLQKLVHEDMRSAFAAYPKTWGLRAPDANIDHRRVGNLEAFFNRQKAAVPITAEAADYRPGDIVSQRLPGGLPHIGIVTARAGSAGPLLVHNIGWGARLDDILFAYKIVGHFRFKPA